MTMMRTTTSEIPPIFRWKCTQVEHIRCYDSLSTRHFVQHCGRCRWQSVSIEMKGVHFSVLVVNSVVVVAAVICAFGRKRKENCEIANGQTEALEMHRHLPWWLFVYLRLSVWARLCVFVWVSVPCGWAFVWRCFVCVCTRLPWPCCWCWIVAHFVEHCRCLVCLIFCILAI